MLAGRGSWCSGTGRAGCTTTCGSRSTACSSAGRSRRVRRWIRRRERLAIHVEDHPLEYFDFEGVIPGGEYGGGDVIVWDTGTWEPVKTDDPRAAVEAGELHAEMHGEKLPGPAGAGAQRRRPGDKEQWLLLHKT